LSRLSGPRHDCPDDKQRLPQSTPAVDGDQIRLTPLRRTGTITVTNTMNPNHECLMLAIHPQTAINPHAEHQHGDFRSRWDMRGRHSDQCGGGNLGYRPRSRARTARSRSPIRPPVGATGAGVEAGSRTAYSNGGMATALDCTESSIIGPSKREPNQINPGQGRASEIIGCSPVRRKQTPTGRGKGKKKKNELTANVILEKQRRRCCWQGFSPAAHSQHLVFTPLGAQSPALRLGQTAQAGGKPSAYGRSPGTETSQFGWRRIEPARN